MCDPDTSAENETSILVVDDLPVISIAEIDDVNRSAGMFKFSLTSDSPANRWLSNKHYYSFSR